MKTWKQKVNIEKIGICVVKEAKDSECVKVHGVNGPNCIAPFSHGFVNLYQNDRWVTFCGVRYAEERKI